ncbi:ABC transporter permease [Paenibacillus faecalis]|uniref:ABC transporter permease n=1 Tax=Paenibacillus faecalis TaxID=2079532 RepID=UPI000D10EEC6|nr:ABC-2 family transporter protein [Paenibacillus faecalis]
MRRFIPIFLLFARNSLSQMLIYRITSSFIIIFGSLFVAAEVISIVIYYQFTDSIAGWGFYDFLALLATFQLISSLYQFLFVGSHEVLMDNIVEGKLDYDLIRPIDSQIICSIKQLDYSSLINCLIPIVLLIYCWPNLDISFSLLNMIIYLTFVLLGVFFYFLLNQFFVTLAFWIERPHKLAGVPEYILEFSSRPMKVYPRVIQMIFGIIFPIITVVNLPVEFLKGEANMKVILWIIVSLIVFFIIVRLQWKLGVKRYASTN